MEQINCVGAPPPRGLHDFVCIAPSMSGRTFNSTKPTSVPTVKMGTANGAMRGPNQSSNIETSSPARRWTIPRGHPLAMTNAMPSPISTVFATLSHWSRRRVNAHHHKYPRQPISHSPIALCTRRSVRTPRGGLGTRSEFTAYNHGTLPD